LRLIERLARFVDKAASRGLGQRNFMCERREIRAASIQEFLIRQPAELRFQLFSVDVHALQCTRDRKCGT